MWYSKLEVRSYLKKKRKAEQGQTDQKCWGRGNVKQGFGVDLKEEVTAADLNAVRRSPTPFSGAWDVAGIEQHHHKGPKNSLQCLKQQERSQDDGGVGRSSEIQSSKLDHTGSRGLLEGLWTLLWKKWITMAKFWAGEGNYLTHVLRGSLWLFSAENRREWTEQKSRVWLGNYWCNPSDRSWWFTPESRHMSWSDLGYIL